MKTPGQLRGYSALLVALAVCLATTGYFLAGRLAPPRPTPSSIPERVALLETPQGPLELPVYAPLNTAQGLLARGRLAEGRGIWYSFPEPREEQPGAEESRLCSLSGRPRTGPHHPGPAGLQPELPQLLPQPGLPAGAGGAPGLVHPPRGEAGPDRAHQTHSPLAPKGAGQPSGPAGPGQAEAPLGLRGSCPRWGS